MKTFRILPWYFLLLIVVLCVAIMSVTEGMVSQNIVKNSTNVDTISTALISRNTSELKKKNPHLYVIVISDTYKGRVNLTKVTSDLNTKMKNKDFMILSSEDDVKTNSILTKVTTVNLSKDNPILVLSCNTKYKSPMASNSRFVISDRDIFSKVNEIIQKYTTAATVKK